MPQRLIVGVDEVGRGPLAGPVVAAAVRFNEGFEDSEIQDSKKLSTKKREQLIERIYNTAHGSAIFAVGPRTIDAINILQAARLAMSNAVKKLAADIALVDGNVAIDCPYPQRCVVGGDHKHVEIAAASILAKVWRDRFMAQVDVRFPEYGLGGNAGYPTKKHKAALLRFGPSPLHRTTFKGVKDLPVAKTFSASAYADAYPLEEVQEVHLQSNLAVSW